MPFNTLILNKNKSEGNCTQLLPSTRNNHSNKGIVIFLYNHKDHKLYLEKSEPKEKPQQKGTGFK